MELINHAIGLSLIGLITLYFISFLYDAIFRPWRLVEEQLMDIEMHIETLKRGGWRAKLHSWISMPAWRGDVEKHLEYLLGLRELKRAELELFEKLRR
ncbi:hypothetical protein E3E36_10940 [Thermococcus sp. M36]|uniref:hypothetical protein n=2 Tax=unclassified Thermococcus TaxID=2627626 RepID=UPI0016A49FDE|nr:hypothetical protein [Thermococcus sp. M36]NJE06640.1 hypothetical protein [Thermococcus sp. M36]